MAEEGGEVSGNKGSFHKKCSWCFKKGTERLAGKYCYACKTFFCGNCAGKHNELFSEHQFSNTGSADIDVDLALYTELCPQHGKSINLYCMDDKDVGCDICIASKHASCLEIAYLPKVAPSILDDIDTNDIKAKLNETIQRFETIQLRQQSSIADILADRDRCLQEIAEHHEELSIILSTIVKSTKDKVLQTFERLHTEMQRDLRDVNNNLAYLKKSEKQLASKQGNDVKLLLEIKKQEKQEQSTENIYSKALESLKVTGFAVVMEKRLHILLTKMESLATVFRKVEAVKVKKRRQVDILVKGEKVCHVSGSCVLPDGSVVLVDTSNKLLKRLEEQSLRIIDQCLMQHRPIDVCCIDRNTLAVTQENKKVVFVSVTPEMSMTRSIQMNHNCAYLTYSRRELFINDNVQSIYVYDMKGTLLRTITTDLTGQQLFSYIQHMAVSDDGEKLYVADGHKGMMTLDRQGMLLDKPVAIDKLSDITGVCLDGAGGLFVTGYKSHNIVHVDPCGKIINESCLVNPFSVCYDKLHKRLFVSQLNMNQLYVCEFV